MNIPKLDDKKSLTLNDITGEFIVLQRRRLGLSRTAFAELVGICPGGIWRIEVKQLFRRDEREHLLNIADRWVVDFKSDKLIDQSTDQPTSCQTSQLVALETHDSNKQSEPVATSIEKLDVVSKSSHPSDALQEHISTDTTLVSPKEVIIAERCIDISRIIAPIVQISPTVLSRQDGIQRISNSEVQTFKRCRRKWWLSYICGYRKRETNFHNVCATGTRIHLALAAWYRPDEINRIDPRDALEAIIKSHRNEVSSQYGDDSSEMTQFCKNIELERIMIAGYLEWLSETGIDANYTVIGSECYLEATLPELNNICIIARLDARVLRAHDNVRLFIDHKTVSSISQVIRTVAFSEQMLWYMLLEELQSHYDSTQRVSGALYNMLRRCKRTSRALPPFYDRIEVHHNLIEIKSFKQRLIGTITDMNRCRDALNNDISHHTTTYPAPTRDCTWDCSFFNICNMANDGSRFGDALEEYYLIGDPYEYYTTAPIMLDESLYTLND